MNASIVSTAQYVDHKINLVWPRALSKFECYLSIDNSVGSTACSGSP